MRGNNNVHTIDIRDKPRNTYDISGASCMSLCVVRNKKSHFVIWESVMLSASSNNVQPTRVFSHFYAGIDVPGQSTPNRRGGTS